MSPRLIRNWRAESQRASRLREKRMKRRTIKAADLFCGAGGTSSGLARACSDLGLGLQLIAINHWDIAIDTHSKNHPAAEHLCTSLDIVDPRKVVPGGRLNLLVASPECTHHSNALGGKPMNDQSRASAFLILRWLDALRVDNVLIENVPEFRNWGPLGTNGRPLKRKRGELYRSFLSMLEALGYKVEVRILNCANYGDPTTRQRLFLQAKRGRGPIRWPAVSHSAEAYQTPAGSTERWRAAREIIDWSLPSQSIFTRKRPLKPNTIARIVAGLRKFSGLPFTIGAGGPSGSQPGRSVDQPLGTVLPDDHHALVEPFIVELHNNQSARSIDDPLSVVATSGAHHGLCEAFVLGQQSGSVPRSVNHPLPTIAGGGAIALCEPYIVACNHGSDKRPSDNGHARRSHSLDEPMPTITQVDAWGLIEPFLVRYHGNHNGREDSLNRTHSLEHPLPALDTSNRYALVEPYLIKYNGTGEGAYSVDDPLATISTKDRFALCIPELGAALDIRFRMLQPHELAAAMSFPADYHFSGNRSDRVKQIGNAVPVRTSAALCRSILEG